MSNGEQIAIGAVVVVEMPDGKLRLGDVVGVEQRSDAVRYSVQPRGLSKEVTPPATCIFRLVPLAAKAGGA